MAKKYDFKELDRRLTEIDTRLWKLENPPKFKYGDRVTVNPYSLLGISGNEGIVRKAKYKNLYGSVIVFRHTWVYSIDDGKELHEVDEDYLNPCQ